MKEPKKGKKQEKNKRRRAPHSSTPSVGHLAARFAVAPTLFFVVAFDAVVRFPIDLARVSAQRVVRVVDAVYVVVLHGFPPDQLAGLFALCRSTRCRTT